MYTQIKAGRWSQAAQTVDMVADGLIFGSRAGNGAGAGGGAVKTMK